MPAKFERGPMCYRLATLEKTSADQAESIEAFKTKERGYETERRKLHNTIQELKGNIRVFCRVRPLLGKKSWKAKNVLP